MKNLLLSIVAVLMSIVGMAAVFFSLQYFDVRRAKVEAEQQDKQVRERVEYLEKSLGKFADAFQNSDQKRADFHEAALPLNSIPDFIRAEWLSPRKRNKRTSYPHYRVEHTTAHNAKAEHRQERFLDGALENAIDRHKFEQFFHYQNGVFFTRRLNSGEIAGVYPVFGDDDAPVGLAVGYFETVLSPTKDESHICMRIFRILDDQEFLIVSAGGAARQQPVLDRTVDRGCELYRVAIYERQSVFERRAKFSLFGLVLGPLFACAVGRRYWKTVATDLSSQCCELSEEVSERIEMQRTLQSLLTLRDYERRTVSSDIHDGFVQEVISASMFLEALAPRIDESDKIAQQQLSNLEHSIKQAIAEGRRLVSRNQMLEVDEIGLLAAIQRLVASHNAKFGIVATLRYSEDIPELDILHQRCVYRVVQEALTNVRRHSGATEAIVTLYTDAGNLCVDISDQGRGFESQSVVDESFGISGMLERVRSLGGELSVRTSIGEGTLVSARLPLQGKAQALDVDPANPELDVSPLPRSVNPESDLT